MISIFLVEDNAIVRKGLTTLLMSQYDINVAGTAAGGLEALSVLANEPLPDIVLTDLNMPDIDGIEVTKRLLQIKCNARVIILTMHRQYTFINEAFAAGAKGYLLKGEDFDDLLNGIRAVHSGETYISPGLAV